MKLTFVDLQNWDYDPSGPRVLPLGGSQSALCYLTAELAQRGHDVSLVSGVPEPREALGVRCYPINQIPNNAILEPADALIVLNGPADLVVPLRQRVARETPIVLWT